MLTRDQEVGLDLPDGRNEASSIGLYGGGNLRGGSTRGDGGEQRAGGDRDGGGQPTDYPCAPHKTLPAIPPRPDARCCPEIMRRGYRL